MRRPCAALSVSGSARLLKNHLFQGTDELELENGFRHAAWQAALTIEVGEDQAYRFGNAHDLGMPKSIDQLVDIHNNKIGREIGNELLAKGYTSVPPDHILFQAVYERTKRRTIEEGKVIINYHDPEVRKLNGWQIGLPFNEGRRSLGSKN